MIWETSEKIAKVMNEHRIVTRIAGVILCLYCTAQIDKAWMLMIAAPENYEPEVAKLIIDNSKWIIGEFIGVIAIGFSVYSGTGGSK